MTDTMSLSDLERFALERVFQEDEAFGRVVRERLAEATVTRREFTGVGFFSDIRFPSPLPDTPERRQWDWNFAHRLLSHGGSFIVFRDGEDGLFLEGVAMVGDWFACFDPADFSDL